MPPEPPRRVESSLLVAQDFVDRDGTEWRVGDRASLARASVRAAAKAEPQRFLVEHESLAFDPTEDWFEAVVQRYDEQYAELKARRGQEEEQRQRALRREMAEQDRGQPELQKRFKQQEKERSEREKRAREEGKRRQIENALEFQSGFHFQQ
jgi:hypothetical protein